MNPFSPKSVLGCTRTIATLLVAFIWCGGAAGSTSPQDWFAAPAMSSLRLSPDGRYAAYFAPRGEQTVVMVMRLQERPWKTRAIMTLASRPSALTWATNVRLLVQSQSADGIRHIEAINRDGSQPANVASGQSAEHRGPQLIHALGRAPAHVLISDDAEQPWAPDVYRVNVFDGSGIRVATNPGDVYAWRADLEGNIRVARAWDYGPDGLHYELRYREAVGQPWRLSLRHALGEPGLLSLGFMPDNQTLVVASDYEADKSSIRLFVPATGQFTATLHADPQVDVGSVNWSAASGAPAFVQYDAARPHYEPLDETWATQLEQIARRVGQQAFRIVQVADGGNRVLVLAYSDVHPGTYFLFEPATQRLRPIGDVMPWIASDRAARTLDISFEARDGRKISGYLTRPADAGPHPTVLLVHGGPWSRDVWGFDPLVQFLASEGLAVLQVNYRGSRGFGRDHLFAGREQWGKRMQTDLEDAVAWAHEAGHSGARQVCIMGSSYGGYAAMMGTLGTDTPYQCAVSWVGVSDLSAQIQSYRTAGNLRGHYEWVEMVGVPDSAGNLENVSPLNRVDEIAIPLFMGHGLQDSQVSLAQALAFHEASLAARKPVSLTTFPGAGHEFHSADARAAFYRSAARFILQHTGG